VAKTFARLYKERMQAQPNKRVGLLISNLGSPDSPSVPDVRKYLKQFLNDPFVFDAPWIIRYPFVNGIILPSRPKKSAEAYQKVWTKEGSPLVVHTKNLTSKLKRKLPFPVEFGMRYGSASIQEAVDKLVNQAVNHIIFLPLYPQYSFSASETAIHEFNQYIQKFSGRITGSSIEYFHQDPGFINAVAEKIKTAADTFQPDAILLSYHGIPEKQLNKTKNRTNYRDQCFETSKLLQEKLGYPADKMITTFQSRLGPVQWIKPYTDQILKELPNQGNKRILAVSPSFTADCLETLEEIQLRYSEDFLAAGGEEFRYVPCVNSSDAFVDAIQKMTFKEINAAAK
jgi:ferrochelatase